MCKGLAALPHSCLERIFPDKNTEVACHFLLQGIFPDRDQVCISYTSRQILHRAKEIKIKLGILLQKPESAIDLIIPYNEKPEKPAKTQKPSLDEALQWRDSLDKLLQNNYGLASFKSFLKSEFSEENLEFWMACEDYKKIKSPVKMAETAKKIYEEFIQAEAPKEVNIDHFTKEITVKNLVEPSPSSFDVAQKRIHALMEKDSLPRFVRSEFYQEFIK